MAKCNECGGEIIFRYIGNVCTPIHLSGGCWSSGPSQSKVRPTRPSPASKPKQPGFWLNHGSITFLTKCWWCGDPVYFYRNEDGGCALFDSLGHPWPIHGCWEAHQADQPKAVSEMLLAHKTALSTGTYRFPSAGLVSSRNGSHHELVGHLHKTVQEFDFIHTKGHGDFIHIEILGNDRLIYHALFPLAWFPHLEGSPLFHIKCTGWKRGNRTDFFPTVIRVFNGKGQENEYQTTMNVQAVVNDSWTFQRRNYKEIWRILSQNKPKPNDQKHLAARGKQQKIGVQPARKAKKASPTEKPKQNSLGIFKDSAQLQAIKDAIKQKDGAE